MGDSSVVVPKPVAINDETLVHVPDVITKQLKFNVVQDRRKARVSTNFLKVMGFHPGDRLSISLNAQRFNGFTVKHNSEGGYKVYERGYRRGRSNNPLEAVVEFGSQKLLDQAFPAYTDNFHVEMTKDYLRFTPMANRAHAILSKFSRSSPLNMFVGLTGGVDLHCLESLGWKTEVVLERRPSKRRDIAHKRDLTEVHALNTLVNGSPRILLNEDFYSLDLDRLSNLLSDSPPIFCIHLSLDCNEFSNAKSKAAKQAAVEDLSTTYDMVYPALKLIEKLGPAMVTIENVKPFASSGAGIILKTTLRRLGYHVNDMVLDATDFGGIQKRERYYQVSSIFPGYKPPAPINKSGKTLRKIILDHISECRDVTDTGYIKARDTKGRSMPPYITVDSLFSSTIMRSQMRGISDAQFVEFEGRVYSPSENMIKKLMSIPEDFNVSWMAKEQAIETLGQSIDYKMHHALIQSITEHANLNIGKHSLVQISRK